MENIKSICLFLGPYRNLTTLTAAILSLHPNCIVLNHMFGEIINNPKINFLSNFSSEKLSSFCEFSIKNSDNIKSDIGGSITMSHAFLHSKMKKAYKKTVDSDTDYNEINSIVWKESQKTANILKSGNNLDELLKKNKQIRFLLPIRNPIDCSISNIITHHFKYIESKKNTILLYRKLKKYKDADYKTVPDKYIYKIIKLIYSEFEWFLSLMHENQDRFFCFFENEINNRTLRRIAEFLELETSDEWLVNSMASFDLKPHYEAGNKLKRKVKKLTKNRFAGLDKNFEQKLNSLIQI